MPENKIENYDIGQGFWQVSVEVDKDRAADVEQFFLQSKALGFFELLYQEGKTANLTTDHTFLYFFFLKDFPVAAFVPMALAFLELPDAPYQIEEVKYADYVKQFEETFTGFALTEKTWLMPPWDKKSADGYRSLVLKPGLAFGTGKHATSRLMVEYIEKNVKEGDIVFDLGCGSGILSLAAVLWGAAEVYGTDAERLAVISALENADLNPEMKARLHFFEGDFSVVSSEQYPARVDVFLANILPRIFYANRDHLKKLLEKSPRWALSGIVDNQQEEFYRWLTELMPGTKIARAEKEEWYIFYKE